MAAKKKKQVQQKPLTDKQYLKQRARKLPIYKCLVSPQWKESGAASLLIMRKHTNGNVTVGFFYIDLFCEGVKDVYWKVNVEEDEMLKYLSDTEEISYDLAHNIIYGAAEYAEENGLKNHEDFALAKFILEEDNEDVPLIEVEFGKNGKPLLMVAENKSNISKLHTLRKTLGEGNFNFVMPEQLSDYGETEDEELEGVDFDKAEFNPLIEENYQYYGFDTPQEAFAYAEKERYYSVFEFLHIVAFAKKEEIEMAFNALTDKNKIRLNEYLYYTRIQSEKMDLKTFIGICFFHTFPESEFDVAEDLIEFEAKEDKETKIIIEELKTIDESSSDKGDKFYEIINKYPASRSIVSYMVNFFVQKQQPENAYEIVKDLFFKQQDNFFLAAQYVFLSNILDKEINSILNLEIQNITKRFPNETKFYSEDVFVMYSAYLVLAFKQENIQLAEQIYFALAKLTNEDLLEQARASIVLMKRKKID